MSGAYQQLPFVVNNPAPAVIQAAAYQVPVAPQTPPAQAPPQDATTTDHDPIDPKQYGNNTPTKRNVTSGVWEEVKRLKGDLQNTKGDATHICLVKLGPVDLTKPPRHCNMLLKLFQNKPAAGAQRTWLTTRAITHLAQEHPIDSPNGAKYMYHFRTQFHQI